MRKPRHERLAEAANGLLLPAVVTSISPLQVLIHGSETSVNSTNACPGAMSLVVNSLVWVTRAGSKFIIMGMREWSVADKYAEEVNLSAQAIGNGATFTTLKNLTQKALQAGYSSSWNYSTGVWTVPFSGWYLTNTVLDYVNWVNGSYTGVNVIVNNAYDLAVVSFPSNNHGAITAAGFGYLNAGDTVVFDASQYSGATQTIASGGSLAVKML